MISKQRRNKTQDFTPLPTDVDSPSPSLSRTRNSTRCFINMVGPPLSCTSSSPWSFELVKTLTYSEDGVLNSFSESFKRVIELVANGKCSFGHVWIKPTIYLLSKKKGGIRPIAVDNIFVRIVGKLLCRMFSPELARTFSNLQFAVGVPAGVETVAHTVSLWIHEILTGSDNVIAHLDTKNAFNTIRRDAILRGLIEYCPELIA